MKKKTVYITIAAVTLTTMLSGCIGLNTKEQNSEPVIFSEPVTSEVTLPTSEIISGTEPDSDKITENEIGRKDGERFETVIMMEGMEETVKYEHVKNDAIGFELDYDYEMLTRNGELNRECFTSVFDDLRDPENYLEVTKKAESADDVAKSVKNDLSTGYELIEESDTLDNAGSCTKIMTTASKSGSSKLQTVYIIPAESGCIVATAHYTIESAEGWGHRFDYIVNTIVVSGGKKAGRSGPFLDLMKEPFLFDVTGDGNDDECSCAMYGSGMVRTDLIVKDTVNKKEYILDGYDYDYIIQGVEDGKLIVVQSGPNGYNKPIDETIGTVKLKDDRLVFVPDPDKLEKGLIVNIKNGSKNNEPEIITILRKGEEVYNGFNSVITIDSVSNREIVLKIEGCLVEPNADGSVNLSKEPLKEITVKRDETVKLVSQTMDGGVKLEIKYE